MFERRNRVVRSTVGGLLLGLAAGLYLGVVEAFSNWRHGAMPPENLEPRWLYAVAGLGLLVAASSVGGLLVGLFVSSAEVASEALAGNRREWRTIERWILTLVLAPAAAYVAFRALSGRRARLLPAHDLLAIALGLTLLAAWWATVGLLLRIARRLREGRAKRWEPWLYGAAGLAAAAGLHELDRTVLPGLYGFFHVGLGLAAWAAALAGLHAAYLGTGGTRFRPWTPLARPTGASVVLAVAILCGGLGARHLVTKQTLRAYVFRRTVLLGKLVTGLNALGLLPRPDVLSARTAGEIVLPPPSGPRLPGRDVFLVTIDALRRDRVGLYDRTHGRTPGIDAFFAKGVRFEWAFTPMPQTSYAITSLMTGSYVTNPRRAAGGWRTTIPALLRRFGYKTAAFYPPAVFYIDRSLFRTYEQTRYGFEYYKVMYHKTEYDDDAAGRVDQVLRFVREWERARRAGRETGEHLFVWVHFFDPHHPYQARKGYLPKGASGDEARYDSEVSYTDFHVARLLAELARLRPNAIFVLTADHGEAFGEHDTSAHGTSLYVEQSTVPMLLRARGLVPKVVHEPVSLADLAPTLLTLLDLPVPPGMEGTDRTSLLDREPDDPKSTPPVFSELITGGSHFLAVAHDHYHLIRELNAETTELYDLAKDPSEEHPEDLDRGTARAMAQRLLGWLESWRLGKSVTTRRSPAELLRSLSSLGPEEKRSLARRLMERRDLPCDLLGKVWGQEPDPEVRDRLAVPLARCKDPRAISHLQKLVSRPDVPPKLLLSAGFALAAVGASGAARALVEAYDDTPSLETKRAVLQTLGRLGSPRAAALLLRELGRPGVASTAARALGGLGTKAVVGRMVQVLLAPNTQALVRQALAQSLARLGGPEAVSALQRLARTESQREVLAQVLASLQALGASIPFRRVRTWTPRSKVSNLRIPKLPRSSVLWFLASESMRLRVPECDVECFLRGRVCATSRCRTPATFRLELQGTAPAKVEIFLQTSRVSPGPRRAQGARQTRRAP